MKKICFFIESLSGGGAERVTSVLANGLSEMYKVYLIVLYKSEDEFPIKENINVIYVYENFNIFNTDSRVLAKKKIESILINLNIKIVLSLCMPHSYFYFLKMFINKKINFIFSERNDPNNYPKKKIYRILRIIGFTHARHVVFQTDSARRYFNKRIQNKSTLILNPIKPNLLNYYVDKNYRNKSFINFCRFDKQKNLKMLIDAFNIVNTAYPEYNLKIVGDGPLKEEIIKYARTNKHIEVLSYMPNIHKYAAKCFAYVSSSDYEGISNSMIEAMGIGLPVICTDCPVGGARLMINDRDNGLLVGVGKTKELADRMIELINNDSLYCHLCQKSIEINERLKENQIVNEWNKVIVKYI